MTYRAEPYEEMQPIKSMESPINSSQLNSWIKGTDIRDFRSADTGSCLVPRLDLYDSGQPVDSLHTKAGREFQFDRDGSATYKITNKDRRGLNDVVTDYMTTRDTRKPTPDQVRKMVDQIAKNPDNRISDVNNIRVGQQLKFPGPEQPPVPRTNLQSHNRPTESYSKEYRPSYPIDRIAPRQRWDSGPNDACRSEYAPHQKPMGHAWNDTIKKEENTVPGPNGSRIKQWKGEVEDGHLGSSRTKANGWEQTDSYGNLISSETKYETRKTIKIPKEGGLTEPVKAMQVRVDFNAQDGKYYYTVQTKDKETIQYRKDKDGNAERLDMKTGRWNR